MALHSKRLDGPEIDDINARIKKTKKTITLFVAIK